MAGTQVFEFIRCGSGSNQEIDLDVSGLMLTFRNRISADGAAVISALLSMNSPGAAKCLQWARGQQARGKMKVIERESTAVMPSPAETMSVERPPPSQLAQAVDNGWDLADLAGAGLDGLTRGGRGAMSGLTLDEMATMSAPPDWAQERQRYWPWQVTDFQPRTRDWVPPSLPEKSGNVQVVVRLIDIATLPERLPPAASAPSAAPASSEVAAPPAAPPSNPPSNPPADPPAPQRENAPPQSLSDEDKQALIAFGDKVNTLASNGTEAQRAAAAVLLASNAALAPQVLLVLLRQRPNQTSGELPVAKLKTALTKGGFPPINNDELLQAMSLVLRS